MLQQKEQGAYGMAASLPQPQTLTAGSILNPFHSQAPILRGLEVIILLRLPA